MQCRRARDLLLADRGASVAEHLERCAACRRFAARAAGLRQALREHRGDVLPDAGFAARVLDRIDGRAADTLGWAAMRLLPAMLVLVALLALWSLTQPAPGTLLGGDEPRNDLLSWTVERAEPGP